MTLDVRTMYIAMAGTCFIVAAALLTLQTLDFLKFISEDCLKAVKLEAVRIIR